MSPPKATPETTLLHRGNRTEVLLLSENDANEARPPSALHGNRTVEKRLLNFANVATERRSLYREAFLQHLARGEGVVAISTRGLGLPLPVAPPTQEFAFFRRDYVEGLTLGELLKSSERSNTQRQEDARFLMIQLGNTLHRLHHLKSEAGLPLGFVHRDISPSNLIVGRGPKSNRYKKMWLNDFGIAHLSLWGALADDETLQGTPRYLSPELRRGEQPSSASDIFQAALLLALLVQDGLVHAKLSPEASLAPSREALLPWDLAAALDDKPKERPNALEFCQQLSR